MPKEFLKTARRMAAFFLAALALAGSAQASFLKDDVNKAIDKNAQNLGDTAGYQTASADTALTVVQTAINLFLSVIGVVLMVYLLYAGYNWMTAQGQEEKVEKAKETIKRAIVGIIIIVAAYAISTFVISGIEPGILK